MSQPLEIKQSQHVSQEFICSIVDTTCVSGSLLSGVFGYYCLFSETEGTD